MDRNQIQTQIDAGIRVGQQTLQQAGADLAAQLGPLAQRAVAAQVNGIVEGLRSGQVLPNLIPAVPAPVDVKADARNRAERTFWQNLALDLVISLAGTLALALGSIDVTTKQGLIALGGLLVKTALSAPISYVMRTKFGVKDTTLPLPNAAVLTIPAPSIPGAEPDNVQVYAAKPAGVQYAATVLPYDQGGIALASDRHPVPADPSAPEYGRAN